jgi:two-component system LytT family response regulator
MSPIRALIVDDKWLVRSELRYMLKPYVNIEIIGEAENGREATQLIQDEKPDVIFLDIHLPDDSGFDLVERLKPDCKIVFISAYNKFLTEAKKYRPIEFLLKPINAKKLSKTIEKLEKALAEDPIGGM